MQTDNAVRVRGLVKRYPDKVAVDGVELDIHRGEVFALLGPNGAGKTTTTEILEGYRRADEGEIAGPVGGAAGDIGQRGIPQRQVNEPRDRGLNMGGPRCGHDVSILGTRRSACRSGQNGPTVTRRVAAGRPRGASARSSTG